MTPEEFLAKYSERRPLLVSRPHKRGHYDGVYSLEDIRGLVSRGAIAGDDLDVTLYSPDKKRWTLEKNLAVGPDDVWPRFDEGGCSVRILHPQIHSKPVWKLLANLAGSLGRVCGANAYLTPRGSQGFAPHYDDVEVFVMQLEGSKRWKVYKPLSDETTLPRYSSRDFDESEIGEPVLDVVLARGDLLYLPRGWIHQARTVPDETHSLHLTVSTSQKTSWFDFLAEALPRALEIAASESLDLRRGLPFNYFEYMGLANSVREGVDEEARARFASTARRLVLGPVLGSLPLDAAADHLCIEYFRSALPPALGKKERARTLGGEEAIAPDINSEVRLVKAKEGHVLARVVTQENLPDEVLLMHTMGNNRDVEKNPEDPGAVAFPLEDATAIEHILAMSAKGEWAPVAELPCATDEVRCDVASALFNEGILEVRPARKRKLEKGVQKIQKKKVLR